MGNRPTALGCHIYGGAFTLGMEKHFDIVGQWEEGPWGSKTFELNFPDIPHPMTYSDWPIDEYKGKVNLVYANPPCAPWSVIGGLKGFSDPRLKYTKNSINLAAMIQPDFFVLESVIPAWTKGREFYEAAARWFAGNGYEVTVLLTNGLLHGVPQNRARFHLIAHKYELDLIQPDSPADDGTLMTVNRAIGDLAESAVWWDQEPTVPNHAVKPPTDAQMMVMEDLKAGEHWKRSVIRLEDKGLEPYKNRVFSRRLIGEAPSCTMVDLEVMVHPWEHRIITLREGARLCGYPDDFVFASNPNGTFRECPEDVTQAVLPAMGEYLGRMCSDSLMAGIPAEVGSISEKDFRPMAKGFGQLEYGRKIGKWPV